MSAFSGEVTAEFVRRYWPATNEGPKHEKLCQAFARAISQGFWAPGARLPTEAELAAVTPCSLGTVQRALRQLAADGLIERRRGSGTIVASLGRVTEQPWHMRFYDDAVAPDETLPVSTRVLKRETTAADGPWSTPLGQEGRQVVRIDRIFTINSELNLYSIVYAIAEKFPTLTSMPLSALDGTNFKMLIAIQHVTPVHRVRQSLRMEMPTPEMVEVSDLALGRPATVVNFIAYSPSGEAVYYQDFYIPPTRYRLNLGTTTNPGG
jgi:DNA-binding GntR family transcriptional regulator